VVAVMTPKTLLRRMERLETRFLPP
jgi:hypothetical protein